MAGGGPEKNLAVQGSFDGTRRFEALFRSACEEGVVPAIRSNPQSKLAAGAMCMWKACGALLPA